MELSKFTAHDFCKIYINTKANLYLFLYNTQYLSTGVNIIFFNFCKKIQIIGKPTIQTLNAQNPFKVQAYKYFTCTDTFFPPVEGWAWPIRSHIRIAGCRVQIRRHPQHFVNLGQAVLWQSARTVAICGSPCRQGKAYNIYCQNICQIMNTVVVDWVVLRIYVDFTAFQSYRKDLCKKCSFCYNRKVIFWLQN